MHKPNLSKMFKTVQMATSKHAPEILTGMGIAGMVTTVVLAVWATPKAEKHLEEAKKEKNQDNKTDIPLTKKETVQATWKDYVPAAVTGGASIACIIGATAINSKQKAALATAFALADSNLKEYQEKVVQTIGEKKERDIRDKVSEDKVKQNPPSSSEVIITPKGNTLCYDEVSGRYFKSDIDKIRKAISVVNQRLMNEMYISLNEFYDEIDLRHIDIGDDLGWNINDGAIEIRFSSCLSEDEQPCLSIGYNVTPRYDFSKLM